MVLWKAYRMVPPSFVCWSITPMNWFVLSSTNQRIQPLSNGGLIIIINRYQYGINDHYH